MFESSVFLDLYIPMYFKRAFQQHYLAEDPQKSYRYALKSVSSFLKFSYSQYVANNLQENFFQFFNRQFSCSRTQELQKQCFAIKSKNNEKAKIIELIESNLDKFSQIFFQLYLIITKIKFRIKSKSLQKHEVNDFCKQIIHAITQTRLNYQFCKFEAQSEKNFDDFILEIFQIVLDDSITKDFQSIVKLIMKNELNNINQSTIQQIQSHLDTKKQSKLNQISRKNIVSNEIFSFLRKGLNKKFRKINMTKVPTIHEKNINNQNLLENQLALPIPTSPQKWTKNKPRQSLSPINRIKSYAKTKKIKPLNKRRTIYFERKNVYQPKSKDLFQKINIFSTQTSLLSQFQKKTQKKTFRYQNSQSTHEEFDSQAILVRSTPKPNKKYTCKMISQKLDF